MNKKQVIMIKKMYVAVLALGLVATSCSNNDDVVIPVVLNSPLTIDLSGLEALGSDYVYEGWIIVDGSPVTTGTFSDVTFPKTFQVPTTQLTAATKFVLSIEPLDDPDPSPAATKVLAGDFSGNSAPINSANIVGDFSASTGKYILATPTDMDMTNETSGVWFLDNTNMPPIAGLDLPELSAGWKYEGWVVVDGTPISTGTFISVAATDDTALFSGPVALPMPNGVDGFFPGEDFLLNEPAGLTFPLDLLGKTVVVSVEPFPDNSAAPFTLKPLAHMIPTNAAVHTPIDMGAGPVVMLSGTATR